MLVESRSFICYLKGVQQIFDVLITIARVLLQCAKYHSLNRARKRGIEGGRSQWLRFPMIQADLIAWSIEWHVASKHLVEKDAHRIHLAALVHVSLEDFRSYIMRSSYYMTIIFWLFTKPGNNAEVGEIQLVVLVEQDIGGFDIRMEKTQRMHVC